MLRHLLIALSLYALCPLGKFLKVSLQWAICDTDPQTVLRKLGDNSTREPYKKTPITYYDTNPPSYIWDGLMFRTKTRRGEELSAVKAHFDPSASDAPERFLWNQEVDGNTIIPDTPERFRCVWDRYGNDVSFACQIQSLLAGRKELWTDEQVRFAERCQSVNWGDLVGFGPNPNPKWRLNVTGHSAVMDDVQAGLFHLMELEVKAFKHEGEEVYQNISTYLGERGIVLCHKQEPKTVRLFHAIGYDRSHRLVQQFGLET